MHIYTELLVTLECKLGARPTSNAIWPDRFKLAQCLFGYQKTDRPGAQ